MLVALVVVTAAMVMAGSHMSALRWPAAFALPVASIEEIAGEAELAHTLFALPAGVPMVDELAQFTRIETHLQTQDVARIEAALQHGHLNKARIAADVLLQQRMRDPVAHQMMGVVLLAVADQPGARQSFEQAVSIDGQFVPALASLAQMDMQEGKTDRALARFEAAMAAGSATPRALPGLSGTATRCRARSRRAGRCSSRTDARPRRSPRLAA